MLYIYIYWRAGARAPGGGGPLFRLSVAVLYGTYLTMCFNDFNNYVTDLNNCATYYNIFHIFKHIFNVLKHLVRSKKFRRESSKRKVRDGNLTAETSKRKVQNLPPTNHPTNPN